MHVQKGDRVLVNAAPFIASPRRQPHSVPCEVVDIDGMAVRVVTQSPCRELNLWVQTCWIDRVLAQGEVFHSPL